MDPYHRIIVCFPRFAQGFAIEYHCSDAPERGGDGGEGGHYLESTSVDTRPGIVLRISMPKLTQTRCTASRSCATKRAQDEGSRRNKIRVEDKQMRHFSVHYTQKAASQVGIYQVV